MDTPFLVTGSVSSSSFSSERGQASASALPNTALGRVVWFMGSATLSLIPQGDIAFVSFHKCLKRLVVEDSKKPSRLLFQEMNYVPK